MTPYSLGIIKVATPGVPVSISTVMASIVGTEVGTFNIGALNDLLLIDVDGGTVAQSVTLTHGAARTATQVASDINGQTVGLTASVAANKVVLTSNTSGATSAIRIEAASGNVVLGFSVGKTLGSAGIRCAKLRLVPLKGNSGDIYIGVKLNFDNVTGDGLIDRLVKPLASPTTLDSFIVESHDEDTLHTQHYFIDADNAGDGVIASYWVA